MKKKLLKILKILLISSISIVCIISIVLYLSLHEKLPKGKTGSEADAFALKIQNAIKHDAYLTTQYIQWTFRNKNHYLWNKIDNHVEVRWDDYKIILDLNHPKKSIVYEHKKLITNNGKQKLITKALSNFNNDSFWVVAPHKLFDKGAIRQLVVLEEGLKALLITYPSGGTTPGDSYLWKVDKDYRPTSFKMWVSILPIGGIEATWGDWTTMTSGAYLSKQHKLLGFGIPISNLKAWNN
ncbi:hypothetical protein [Aquimarina longa]|uniref:hypothetical protein n=1 Tax=Aquimarina longa TaxID=1080221 RepID=UPI000780ECCC|nr:hypothetical protein [Aquimarina longa]